MQPLDKLLSRIMWDPAFGKGAFVLGYEDRVAQAERRVRLESVTIDRRGRGMLSIEDEDGVVVRIPFHRVRTVYKDGAIIWQRPSRTPRREKSTGP